jgi:hypothetical protein
MAIDRQRIANFSKQPQRPTQNSVAINPRSHRAQFAESSCKVALVQKIDLHSDLDDRQIRLHEHLGSFNACQMDCFRELSVASIAGR